MRLYARLLRGRKYNRCPHNPCVYNVTLHSHRASFNASIATFTTPLRDRSYLTFHYMDLKVISLRMDLSRTWNGEAR